MSTEAVERQEEIPVAREEDIFRGMSVVKSDWGDAVKARRLAEDETTLFRQMVSPRVEKGVFITRPVGYGDLSFGVTIFRRYSEEDPLAKISFAFRNEYHSSLRNTIKVNGYERTMRGNEQYLLGEDSVDHGPHLPTAAFAVMAKKNFRRQPRVDNKMFCMGPEMRGSCVAVFYDHGMLVGSTPQFHVARQRNGRLHFRYAKA